MMANVNNFDQSCLKHLKILENAEAASLKMTTHKEADDEVKALTRKIRKQLQRERLNKPSKGLKMKYGLTLRKPKQQLTIRSFLEIQLYFYSAYYSFKVLVNLIPRLSVQSTLKYDNQEVFLLYSEKMLPKYCPYLLRKTLLANFY